MAASDSAFKLQTEKKYGSVEKMYIHFYTVASDQDTLDIFWYSNDIENIELFSDVKYFFNKMKSYGQYSTYTGDVFVIKNLHRFKELLILVGAEDNKLTEWILQGDNCLSVNTCKINKPSKFYELFDICFEDYEIINSFSSEPTLSKNRIEMDEFITKTPNTLNNPLILVHFNKERFPMPYYKFNQLYYTEIKSKVGDITLNTWFNSVITKNTYSTVYNTIHKLIEYNEKETDDTPNDDDDDKDDTTIIVEQESAKISHDEWIKLFCDLYLDDSKGSDLLLSDIYQMYLTASGWTQTSTISMATFIKRLRNMNKFTIKRRAKGMMIIGVSCLVNQQAELFTKVKKGQAYNRQLLHFKSDIEINNIFTKYKDEIEKIGHKYAREAFILLNNSNITLDYQTVSQFVSIPQISTQLKPYSDYIDSIIKNIPNVEVLANGKKVRKFNTEIKKPLEEFRELCNKCVIYFPFSSNKSISSNKSNFIYDLNVAPGPSAFNEHFGMFLSSKEYHLFEPEKSTPQEYNNMVGTPIDTNTIITDNTSKKDFDLWRRGIF